MENLNLKKGAYLENFSEVELHEGNANTHTHIQKYWSVSPVVGVVVPGEDICYSVSGPRSSFSKTRAGVSGW